MLTVLLECFTVSLESIALIQLITSLGRNLEVLCPLFKVGGALKPLASLSTSEEHYYFFKISFW